MGGKILKEAEGVGLVFGRLTVTGWAHVDSRNHRFWKCQCECGNTAVLEMYPLKIGNTVSCGCYKADSAGTHSLTHGATARGVEPSLNRLYKTWTKIRERCSSPINAAYADYGGRGIVVSDDWQVFENFYRDMGIPAKGMTVERKDVNLGYNKENCVWLPLAEQNDNKRTTIRVNYEGAEWCLKRLCEHLALPYIRTYKRYVMRDRSLSDSLDISSPNNYESTYFKSSADLSSIKFVYLPLESPKC